MRTMVLTAVLVGCSEGDDGGGSETPLDAAACTAEDITLEVGTGKSGYVPLEDGDPVTMVHGPQGGWHVETGGRLLNSEREIAIYPSIRSEDLEVTGDQQPAYQALADYEETTCEGVFYGVRTFVEATRDSGPTGLDFVCALAGRTVTFALTTEDLSTGRQETAEVDVVLALDPIDVPNCP